MVNTALRPLAEPGAEGPDDTAVGPDAQRVDVEIEALAAAYTSIADGLSWA
jgi:hypothetical protein